mgnify:CR=1 FL=1
MWLTSKQNPLTAKDNGQPGKGTVIWARPCRKPFEDLGSREFHRPIQNCSIGLSYQFNNRWMEYKKIDKKYCNVSATIKDSKVTPDLLQVGSPNNKYYARASRVRLSAEQIRDQSLWISGVFCDSMYGLAYTHGSLQVFG